MRLAEILFHRMSYTSAAYVIQTLAVKSFTANGLRQVTAFVQWVCTREAQTMRALFPHAAL
jgi:uncharacterized protein (DUF2342 family)